MKPKHKKHEENCTEVYHNHIAQKYLINSNLKSREKKDTLHREGLR